MAKHAYRKAGRQTGLWVIWILLAGATPFWVGWGTQYFFGEFDWRGPVLVLLALAAMIVVILVWSKHKQ